MHYLPNLLSFARFPLAFLFLQDDVFYRCLAIILALITDGLDGFLARKYGSCSWLGTILDPITDKFFVCFAMGMLISEERLAVGAALTMLSRDFAILFFGTYLMIVGKLRHYQCRAIWCGKITTCFQLVVLLALICGVAVPQYLYVGFVALGVFALFELHYSSQLNIKFGEKG